MDQQRLERALRQGPAFATRYVPSPLLLDTQPVVRHTFSGSRLVLIIAVTALLLIGMLAGLAALGAFQDRPGGAKNGWVAFTRDGDIYLVREGQAAHRIISSESDGRDQICPVFSPDGTRLAYGEAEVLDSGYRGAALVVSDVDPAGNVSESRRIEVGGTLPPPCANWSADGRHVAFSVPLTSPINPDRSAAGSEVWVAKVEDGQVEVLSDLLATDLEWSPEDSELAIASGQSDLVSGNHLRDGSLRLYDADSGSMRTLVGPSGVTSLTWSPDGSQIAYQRGGSTDSDAYGQEIRVAAVEGNREYLLAGPFAAIHGLGPVWSPTGEQIVYQRCYSRITCVGERHEVVLVTLDGGSEVVLPPLQVAGTDESAVWLPWRVTWSPDGRELLYSAWKPGVGGTALISVPLDRGSDPVVLDTDASGYDADHGRGAPVQSWARRPDA
jgi:Tol biopolymer transport system component